MKWLPKKLMRSVPSRVRTNVKNRIFREDLGSTPLMSLDGDRRLPHLTSPSFPASWRSQIQGWLKRAEFPQVCIVVHAYHLQVLDEIILKLLNIGIDFDLVVTNSSNEDIDQSHITQLLRGSKVNDTLILKTENRGRDILPLIHCVNSGILDEYRYIVKLHTKVSEWAMSKNHIALGQGGSVWRQNFLNDLIGNGENFTQIIDNLSANIDLGLVTENKSLLGSTFWTANLPRTQQLALRIELEFSPEELIFPAGSMYVCKGLVIQGLRALCLSGEDFEDENGALDGTTAHAVERLIGLVAAAGGYEQKTLENLNPIRDYSKQHSKHQVEFISFYLPQFHSDPLNDVSWGKNFTEWHNVTRALPQFSHHLQPLLPTDLGFYNLESQETVIAQEKLAEKYGMTAFMYYYYNFGDSRPLEKPIVNRLTRTGGLPFSLIWVNENWSRNWDGLQSDLIAEQQYTSGWENRLVESIKPFLLHPDFLKDSENRPVFSIYRPRSIPNIGESIARIREHAATNGIGDLHILFADTGSSFPEEEETSLVKLAEGFHAFPPHGAIWKLRNPSSIGQQTSFRGNIYSYDPERYLAEIKRDGFRYHLGVLTRFDNTPRRGARGHIIYGSNPYVFRRALLEAKRISSQSSQNERYIFINAWNEWAEGAILEPSNRFGKTYLQALREIEAY